MKARGTLTVVVVLMFVSTISASAKELWEEPWIEVKSPHFTIVSAISEERTIDLTRELENFREAVQIVTDIGRFDERIPTTVYVLPRRVEELGFTVNVGGYLLPLMRANYAVIAPWSAPISSVSSPRAYCSENYPCLATQAATGSSRAGLNHLLKHEYVHFLVHNRDEHSAPPWFDEGYAEMLATLTVRGRVIEYGQTTSDRMSWLRFAEWMPFTTLLDTRNVVALNSDNNGKFYVQSWLLLHYLMNGRSGHKFESDNRVFVELSENGAEPTEAFEQAFGLKVTQLDLILSRYWKRVRPNRVELAQALSEASVQVFPLSADSIAARLGMLLLLFERTEDAQRFWDAAIALNPNNATALVGLGDVHKLAGHFDDARPYYEKAIEVEPHNAYAELNFAEYFLARAAATGTSENEITGDLTEARRHFARSHNLDPDDPETLAMNGSSYLFPGQTVDKALQSLTASHEMLPSQPDIKLLLATAYLKSGDRASAVPILRSLVAWSHGKSGEAAYRLLQQLAGPASEDHDDDTPKETPATE